LAKRAGAEVFTTVGAEDKKEVAASAGADHVILYRDVPFDEAVVAVAGERPLDVVFDGVGAATFDAGLKLLRPRGMMVTFGNASGPVTPVAPLTLSTNGSLFLTRPTLGDYIRQPSELQARGADLFRWVSEGTLDVHIGATFPMEEAADAHRALEGRMTTGKLLITPQ
jgi:NADPH2:quinone reductase